LSENKTDKTKNQSTFCKQTNKDINLKEMYVDINKRIKKGIVDTPKTQSSIRKIPIFKILKPYLISQIELAKKKKTDCLFFTRNKTCYYSSDRIHRRWYKLLEEASIKKRVMYNTRHTFATLSIKNGLDIYFVSQTMGHKNIQETLTIYTKFLPDNNLKIKRDINILVNKS
jgi:integrase